MRRGSVALIALLLLASPCIAQDTENEQEQEQGDQSSPLVGAVWCAGKPDSRARETRGKRDRLRWGPRRSATTL